MPDTLTALNARLAALGDDLDAAAVAHDASPTRATAAALSALWERYEPLAREQQAALTAHLEAQREQIAALEEQARRIRERLDGTASTRSEDERKAYDAAHTLPELLGRLIGEWDQDAEDHTDPSFAGERPFDALAEHWRDEGYRCGILAARDSLAKLLRTAGARP